MKIVAIIASLFLLFSTASAGKFYKCKSTSGAVSCQAKLCSAGNNQTKLKNRDASRRTVQINNEMNYFKSQNGSLFGCNGGVDNGSGGFKRH